MEKHMAQTMIEFDSRIPYALRFALSPYPPPRSKAFPRHRHEQAVKLAAAMLAPRPRDDDDGGSDPLDDCDEAGAEEPEGEGHLRMVFASSYIKHHDEDAHFGHADAGVIGVADGVGGYRRDGVDAAAFSRGLMRSAYAEVAASAAAAPGMRFCPLALLERAHQATAAARTPGASTAAIVSLAGGRGRTLKWAYVGDSGFLLLRNGRIVRRSVPQQHHFNCPYKLSSSRQNSTRLADAAVGEVAAREGDVVVLATDGLFDNVFDDEIERIVRMGTAMGFAPENMAEVVAGFASEAASCGDRDPPYRILERSSQPGKCFLTGGGKPDDITVVVAYIVSCPSQSQT